MIKKQPTILDLLAAEQGLAKEQVNLRIMYAEDEGVLQDYKESIKSLSATVLRNTDYVLLKLQDAAFSNFRLSPQLIMSM